MDVAAPKLLHAVVWWTCVHGFASAHTDKAETTVGADVEDTSIAGLASAATRSSEAVAASKALLELSPSLFTKIRCLGMSGR